MGRLSLKAVLQSNRAVRLQRKGTTVLAGLLKAFFLFGFCFVILWPVITMLLKSFMSHLDLYDNSVALIPKNFTLQNFKAASMTLNYWEALKNTGIITLTTTLLQTVSCMMVGYGFARHEFKGKGILFALVLLTVVVPPQLLEIPYFMQFRYFDIFGIFRAATGEGLNLINQYAPFWMLGATCMGIKNGIFIFLFRQFFRNLPKELEEAGRIDGANSFGIFVRIMVPNAVTIIVTVVLLSIVWQYNDVTYTRIFFINKPSFSTAYSTLYTITDQVKELLGYGKDDIRASLYYPLLKSAGSALMVLPLLVFYAFAQKFFVDSVARAGIVG